MLFLSFLSRRAKRVLLCLKRSAVNTLALSMLFTAAAVTVMLFTSESSGLSSDGIINAFFLSLTAAWIIAFNAQLVKYRGRLYHRYDEEVIGEAFTGLDRSSMMFEKAQEHFHAGHFGTAHEILIEIDDADLTQKEKGVLAFYKARCCQIIGWYHHAAVGFEQAEMYGFYIPEMPIFRARCLADSGDTENAIDILLGLMDTDYRYSYRMRNEIGNIYLKLNDGDKALRWFSESIAHNECYAASLGGAAIAQVLLRNFSEGEELYRKALLNNIEDSAEYTRYYKKIQAAVMLGTDCADHALH